MLLHSKPLPSSLAADENIVDGEDILMKIHHKPYMLQLDEAVRLGLGDRVYELVELN
jgi:uncharacterized Fe-S center protein